MEKKKDITNIILKLFLIGVWILEATLISIEKKHSEYSGYNKH